MFKVKDEMTGAERQYLEFFRFCRRSDLVGRYCATGAGGDTADSKASGELNSIAAGVGVGQLYGLDNRTRALTGIRGDVVGCRKRSARL